MSAQKEVTASGHPCITLKFIVKLLKSMKAKRLLVTTYQIDHLEKEKTKIEESKFKVWLPQTRYYLDSRSHEQIEIGINVTDSHLKLGIGSCNMMITLMQLTSGSKVNLRMILILKSYCMQISHLQFAI